MAASAAGSTAVTDAAERGVSTAASGIWSLCSCLGRYTKKCCNAFGGCIKRLPVSTVAVLLRVFNLANAFLLGAASFFAYSIVNGSVTRTFLATYIMIFAAMLFLFETRIKYTTPFIRHNCGFLFTYTGRSAFLVFIGAVCFGMLGDDVEGTMGYDWCITVGFATLGNALFNCFIICNHPGYQELNKLDPASPAGNDPSRMTEAQIKAYLEAHPEIAAAALGEAKGEHTAVSVAAEPREAGGADWARAAEAKQAKSGGGGFGFGGLFGGGRGKGGKGAAAPAEEAYVPPSVPVAVEAPVFAAEAAPAAAPERVSPRAAAPVAPAAPAAPAQQAAFAIDDAEDNPFAANDNPFGAR